MTSRARYCSPRCRVYANRKRNVFPAVMRDQARWVRASGKRPVRVNGRPASSTNPATWSTYAEVQASTVGDGYGVMLGNGIGCYDLDACFKDGELEDWALEVIEKIAVPVLFVEKSMSGHGLHVFTSEPEGSGSKKGNVEHYSRARFIRTTGDKFKL